MGKKRGAPLKPPEKRKTELLPIRLTKEDRVLLKTIAVGKVSAWAREVLLRAARQRAKAAGRRNYDPVRASADSAGTLENCCACTARAALRIKVRKAI
jgi:hypothetical protein